MVFRNIPNPKNARITYVWVALRKHAVYNHCAVILEIDDGKYYVNTQKNSGKNNIHLDYFYTKKSAAEATIKFNGINNAVRLCAYGSADLSWENFYRTLNRNEPYLFGVMDCQE
jgi:hypothetical protein